MGSKGDVWWVWAALAADTRQVVGVVAGDRSEVAARSLWEALPDEYRDGAGVRTDFLARYEAVIPRDRHAPGGKGTGQTNHPERFWCTLRQRCSRVVRKTLSFSKCSLNHLGPLGYFVRLDNACRL